MGIKEFWSRETLPLIYRCLDAPKKKRRSDEYTVLSQTSAHGRSQLKGQNLRVGGYTENSLKWFNYPHARVDLPSDSLCENFTLKNHKTVKIGGWALAWLWVLAWDNTVVQNFVPPGILMAWSDWLAWQLSFTYRASLFQVLLSLHCLHVQEVHVAKLFGVYESTVIETYD